MEAFSGKNNLQIIPAVPPQALKQLHLGGRTLSSRLLALAPADQNREVACTAANQISTPIGRWLAEGSAYTSESMYARQTGG